MNNMWWWQTTWFLACSLVAAGTASAASPDPQGERIWQVVAKSHVIVVGTLQVPVEAIRKSISAKNYEYVQLTVRCDDVLKATAATTLPVRWYTEPREYSPSPQRILALDGKKAILCLLESDGEATKGFYFADGAPCALSEANAGLVERVRSEVKAQQELLEHFTKAFPPKDEPLYWQVKGLIDAITHKDTQMAAFGDLEALGPKAVPAIILLMDDRRELAEKAISLRNPPGQWEGIRHYAPKTVTDAMAAILNQITAEDFGMIENGGTERERREAVNGWRIYLHHWRNGEFNRTEAPSH